jgi:SAM-dependent methyltransferase
MEKMVYFSFKRIKQRRIDFFVRSLTPERGAIVLDIGTGGGELWTSFHPEINPSDFYLIGLDLKLPSETRRNCPYSAFVVADGRSLPFKDGSVDIIFSNSVLEHVGDEAEQKRMAQEVLRVGKSFFIQVPNKHFPIEPHFFVPFMQYLPVRVQVKITSLLFRFDEPIYLPSRRTLNRIFPSDCHISAEKFMGLTKAFYIWCRGK